MIYPTCLTLFHSVQTFAVVTFKQRRQNITIGAPFRSRCQDRYAGAQSLCVTILFVGGTLWLGRRIPSCTIQLPPTILSFDVSDFPYMLTLTIQQHSEQISAPLSKRRASGKRIKEDKIIMTEGRLYGRFHKTEIPTTTQLLERALRLTLEENTFNFNGKNFFQTHKGTEKRKSYWEQPLQGHPLKRASEISRETSKKKVTQRAFSKKQITKKTKKKHFQKFTLDHRKLTLRQIQKESKSILPLATQCQPVAILKQITTGRWR